jgi:hypothetical protein
MSPSNSAGTAPSGRHDEPIVEFHFLQCPKRAKGMGVRPVVKDEHGRSETFLASIACKLGERQDAVSRQHAMSRNAETGVNFVTRTR